MSPLRHNSEVENFGKLCLSTVFTNREILLAHLHHIIISLRTHFEEKDHTDSEDVVSLLEAVQGAVSFVYLCVKSYKAPTLFPQTYDFILKM